MRSTLAVGGVGLVIGAWYGYRPLEPQDEPAAAVVTSEPCPPNTVELGLRAIEGPSVDPGLDPELVGRPVARPPVGPEWSEASLERALAGMRPVLYCDEWPCIVEVEVPWSDLDDPYGFEVVEEVARRLAAVGADASVVGTTTPDEGRSVSSGRFVLWSAAEWTDPNAELRTAVRLFWLGEGELP